MTERISRLDLADTRDRIRELTSKKMLLARSKPEVGGPGPDEISTAVQAVENAKLKLAEAKAELQRLRGERQVAKAKASMPSTDLSETKRELSRLRQVRTDQAKQLLIQGESVQDVADYSGLSVPRIYQIRDQAGLAV